MHFPDFQSPRGCTMFEKFRCVSKEIPNVREAGLPSPHSSNPACKGIADENDFSIQEAKESKAESRVSLPKPAPE